MWGSCVGVLCAGLVYRILIVVGGDVECRDGVTDL